MTPGLVSVIIPSRNEPYLHQTVKDLLTKAKDLIEIIVILDGYWPPVNEIIEDPRVIYLHHSTPKGMRRSINAGVALAKGEFILKTDAHCLFAADFDTVLKADCPSETIIVPRRYALDPVKWELEENPKYPVDYMYLSKDLHGEVWTERNKNPELADTKLDELMSAQGSCWFMQTAYYAELELLDEETYGTFFSEFQEIGLKCWLSGGRVLVNKNTWYAHWHKPKDVGRGYHLEAGLKEQAEAAVARWRDGKGWHKQIHSIDWLVERFKPVPTW